MSHTANRRKRDARHPLARLADKGVGNTPLSRKTEAVMRYSAREVPRSTGTRRRAADAALSALRVQRARATYAPITAQDKGKGRFRDKLRGLTQRISRRRG